MRKHSQVLITFNVFARAHQTFRTHNLNDKNECLMRLELNEQPNTNYELTNKKICSQFIRIRRMSNDMMSEVNSLLLLNSENKH